jgi:O-antigen ligase
MRYWIYLFILSIPLDPNASIGFLPTFSALDYFCVSAFLALAFRVEPHQWLKKTWNTFPFYSGIAWTCFLLYGLLAAHLLNGNIHGVLRWGEFLFCYVLTKLALDEEEDIGPFCIQIANLLSFTAMLISIYAIAQFSFSEGNASRVGAMFGQRNVMAAYLSLCLPACSAVIPGISTGWIQIRKVSSFLTICALVISYSRGAWVGIAAGIFTVAWILKRYHIFRWTKMKDAIFIVLLLIGPLAVILFIRNPNRHLFSFSERPIYWQATWHVVHKHPWIGMGPGNYYRRLPDFLTGASRTLWDNELRQKTRVDFWQHLHNLYFQIIVEFGLIGFFFWGFGLYGMLRQSIASAIKSPDTLDVFFLISIMAYLFHNLVDMLAVNSLDLLFVMLLAITSKPLNGTKKSLP